MESREKTTHLVGKARRKPPEGWKGPGSKNVLFGNTCDISMNCSCYQRPTKKMGGGEAYRNKKDSSNRKNVADRSSRPGHARRKGKRCRPRSLRNRGAHSKARLLNAPRRGKKVPKGTQQSHGKKGRWRMGGKRDTPTYPSIHGRGNAS